MTNPEALPLAETPQNYYDVASRNYDRTELTVGRAIARGILNAEHELPTVEWLEERLRVLCPYRCVRYPKC